MRHLTFTGAEVRYGTCDQRPDADRRLEHELAVIDERGFPGYFLIVREIADFARQQGILCRGRSAANSAVCYALGITAADSILYGLPFERFLVATREEDPTSMSTSTPIAAKRTGNLWCRM